MSFQMEISQDEIKLALKSIKGKKKSLLNDIDELIKKTAVYVMDLAKVACPIRTGRLKASLHILIKGESDTNTYQDNEGNSFDGSFNIQVKEGAVVGTNVEYAERVENGEIKTEFGDQPFLSPAFEKGRIYFFKRLKEIFK